MELGKDAGVWSLIVDFEDAFMSTGTLACEQRFTTAEVDDPSSPSGKYVYVWHTLGFGGKTFPLVYARPASFASRTAQALMDPERTLLQLYVDDPACSLVGTKNWALTEARVPIHWWVFLYTGVLALILALGAVSIQTLRAANSNPTKSLKYE